MITIYGLFSTENGIVRYIGQCKITPTLRMYRHIHAAKHNDKTHRSNWIRKVLKSGHEIGFTVLKENAVWNVDEIALIKHYRNLGFKLVNGTVGGDGVLGLRMSEHARKLMREKKIGKKLTLEHTKKISDSLKGKPRSKEFCFQMKESMKGNKNSLGTKRTQEFCKQISERQIGNKYALGHVQTKEDKKKKIEARYKYLMRLKEVS